MTYIRQRNKLDCGVAALAMLCDVTYEEANRAIPWRREGILNGTTTKQLRDGGLRLGYVTRSTPGDRLKVIQAPKGWVEEHGSKVDHNIWSFIPENSLVKVPGGDHGRWHWVVWRKGRVYDPAIGVFRPRHYVERFSDKVPSSYMQFVPEGAEDCPECGTVTEAKWSGVECPDCGWTSCF